MTSPKMIFVNLPVSDLERSVRFYEAIGARKEPKFSDEKAAAMVISETTFVMLLTNPFYATFTGKPIADAHNSSQVLLAISCENRESVDRMVEAAASAGGKADPGPSRTMESCTAAASRIPTAIIGSRCGWTRTSPSRARTRTRKPHKRPRPETIVCN